MPDSMEKNSLGIPIAIVLAAGLIAGALYFSGLQNNTESEHTIPTETETFVPAVSEDDHILGNPNAPIVIVEYSDYDCPFCKSFHATMHQIIDEYGPSGQVAWVSRHFPLSQLHPNAPLIASAAECAAELGGNDAYWQFSDLVFEERETNARTDVTRLPEFASRVGLDGVAFEECLNSGRYRDLVEADFAEAVAAGGRGTPFPTILVGEQQGPIEGAQPYAVIKQMIDTILVQLGNE